jgi:hypothetical protein
MDPWKHALHVVCRCKKQFGDIVLLQMVPSVVIATFAKLAASLTSILSANPLRD